MAEGGAVMKEIILENKKNGLAVMLVLILLEAAAVVGLVLAAVSLDERTSGPAVFLLVVCIVWLSVSWVLFLGLKVLKPQEALVLTIQTQALMIPMRAPVVLIIRKSPS